MSGLGTTPLFIDTSAFYARIDDHDVNHERARQVFTGIQTGDLSYRPLYTTGYVLAELVSLALTRADRVTAASALEQIQGSDRIHVSYPNRTAFSQACEEFHRYEDQDISLVDHLSGVIADESGIEHVFTFDYNDFRTLGFTVVPEETGEA